MEGDKISSFREAVHIEAPVSRVWAIVTDVKRHPQFAGPKSITKVIVFDGPLAVGAKWVAHEKFGPQKFDAPSEITKLEPEQEFAWVSFPPMKDENRGAGGRVLWSYVLAPRRRRHKVGASYGCARTTKGCSGNQGDVQDAKPSKEAASRCHHDSAKRQGGRGVGWFLGVT